MAADPFARSWADAAPTSFWVDSPRAPDACAPLEGDTAADLAIVGGGFTGLWAAIQSIPSSWSTRPKCEGSFSPRNGSRHSMASDLRKMLFLSV